MRREQQPTVAVLTDLWPSSSEPYAGSFVRSQVEALRDEFRHVVLVPRLLLPAAHGWIWRGVVQGRQRGWEAPLPPGRLLRYPIARVPKVGEADVRALSARFALAWAGERPAVVHGHFLYEVGVAAVQVGRALECPTVVTVHGTDARWLLDGGIQDRHRRRMLAAARAADRVVVVERSLAERLSAAGVPAERLAVVPMGVDELRFRVLPRNDARVRLGLPEETRIVLFVGRGTVEKGIDVLDRALADVAADCIAIGPPGDGGRIRFAGQVAPVDVPLWLAAADVFCLPSRSEGMPVSVMEALAAGLPVVATTVGGIPEQLEEGVNGLLVPPGDAGALAQALRAALDREWDEAAIRATSERFWWSRLAPRLAALYEDLL